MIDLDPLLSRWAQSAHQPTWNAEAAVKAAAAIAAATGWTPQWEPGDEQWIVLVDSATSCGMVSIVVPLALLTAPASTTARALPQPLAVVDIPSTAAEVLCATPDLLRATVLPHGWDRDFDPGHFCAHDLTVEAI